MTVILYLLPLALLLGSIGLMAFMWTLRSGQYDDLDGAAWRAIMDDDKDLIPHLKKKADSEEQQDDVHNSDKSA